MSGKATLLATFTVAAIAATACAPEHGETVGPTLAGHFSQAHDSEPLIADEAYLGDRNFYVRFRRGDEEIILEDSAAKSCDPEHPSLILKNILNHIIA